MQGKTISVRAMMKIGHAAVYHESAIVWHVCCACYTMGLGAICLDQLNRTYILGEHHPSRCHHTTTGNAWCTPLHLSQCFSHSTYIISQNQYYTNLHINTVFLLDHSIFVQSVSLSPSICMDTECCPALSSFTRECILWQWIKLLFFSQIFFGFKNAMLRNHVGFEPGTFHWTGRRLTNCAMVFEQIDMNILECHSHLLFWSCSQRHIPFQFDSNWQGIWLWL